MQNSIDRQRPLQRYGQSPGSPVALVAKCAAGFLILLLLLLIGLTAPDDDAGRQTATNATPAGDLAAQHPPAAAGSERP